MSSRNKLGLVLKSRRKALGLSQRALAAKLGVEASYVAFLESGRRKPSLSLAQRLARTLGVDRQELFLLVHPEAKSMFEPAPKPEDRSPAQSWQELISDKALLTRYEVTPLELRAMKQLSLLGYVLTQREFLTIVTVIRGTAVSKRGSRS
ncbi:MAG TPA: helix-turn-helix domain-containing protein [Candidatus Binataceae bacterium]|nr:helix-turn-helix domain-containing protein [Candidatus Binataceae bacterium]